jgi:hypothetical protein
MANGDLESNNIGDIIVNYRLLSGADIDIDDIFDKHMKPNINELLKNEFYGINVGGICEHCGLMSLSLKKKDDKIYLIAWCWKSTKENNTGKYKIAIINDNNELDYQYNEVEKYYNE